MKLNNLNDLFIHELRDLHNAEQQITKALPKMIKKTSSDNLRQAFESHLDETKLQIDRLEKIFDMVGVKPSGVKCKAMEGIIREGEDIMNENASPAVMDAALIAAAQRVEHYEIASYGTVHTYARQLGVQKEIIDLLETTLSEEKNADMKLSQIAETSVNLKAE